MLETSDLTVRFGGHVAVNAVSCAFAPGTLTAIVGPNGDVLAKAGAVRDGGSYEQRMGGIACWNAVMDENEYMVRKWNEFGAA